MTNTSIDSGRRETGPAEVPTLDTDFSRLMVDEGNKSYYVNNILWSTLANEVRSNLHAFVLLP